jgi:diguanylate cyclase (GGDEF)-like protein/PAS domain S-box-containing protein
MHESMGVGRGKSAAKSFRAISLGAKLGLAIIGLFSLLSFLITSRLETDQTVDGVIKNAANAEQVLCGRTIIALQVLRDPAAAAEDKLSAIDTMKLALAMWKSSHLQLEGYARREGADDLSAANARALALRSPIEAFVRSALMGNMAEVPSGSELRKYHRAFVDAQSRVIRELQFHNSSKYSWLKNVSLGFLIVLLGLLVAEHWLIFRPLVRRVHRSFHDLEDHRDELEAMREELAQQNATLSESQTALTHAVHRAEDMARLSRYAASRFEELFTSLPIAAFTFDSAGTVFEWNRESESLFGLPVAKALGQSIPDLIARREEEHEYDLMVRGVFEGDHLYNIERVIRRPNGELRRVLFNAFPLRDPEGSVTGGVCSMVDVTEQRAAEERLKQSERRFRTIVEDIPTGAVLIENGYIHINRYVEAITGYRQVDIGTLDEWFDLLYPGRADEVRALYHSSREAGFPESLVVGVTRADGQVRSVKFSAVEFGTHEIWLLHDVTEELATQERFRILFELSSDAHLLYSNGVVVDCNSATVKLLGATDKSDIVGCSPDIYDPEVQSDGASSQEARMEAIEKAWSEGFNRFEWTHRKLDGAEFPVEVTLTPVTINDEKTLLVVWHDLTERKAAENAIRKVNEELGQALLKLETLATTDGLTGLKNHRSFQEFYEKQFAIATRHGQGLSILLLDVDNFKSFNDEFGHQAGDEVLRGVADALMHAARDSDFVARYGGEEFVVVLPGVDATHAREAADRYRKVIAEVCWTYRQVTASFGIATVDEHDDRAMLITEADRALYESKRRGRNCCTHSDDIRVAA